MEKLRKILQALTISEKLHELVFSDIKIPILSDYVAANEYWYPHPPCLIPLFLGNGASYKGIIQHFFCDRKKTFVEFVLEQGYFSEIARNENQLFTLLVLKMMVIQDGISEEIVNFCRQLEFENLKEVDEYSLKYGDNLENPSALVFYNSKTPFKYINNLSEYDGDYPSSLTIINSKRVMSACSYEFSDKALLETTVEDMPNWLRKNENKKNLFDQYISNNQLKEAWFTLNSKGWLLADMAEALQILKINSDNELLHLVADNWTGRWLKSEFSNDSLYII